MGAMTPLTSFVLAAAAVLPTNDWPAWRGPTGDGVATSPSAPLEWDAKKNVKWRVALAQPANGSPIVSNGRVFLTMPGDAEGKQRGLHCYDRASGKELWARTVTFDKVMPTHKTNPYCGSTPASDGERVVVWHASAGLHCYDFDGKELWQRDLGEFSHQWGYGTSPLLHDGKVILHTGPGAVSFVTALDLETGETVWRADEPSHLDAEALAKKRLVGSWCTPLITRAGDRELIVCAHPTRVCAYDPRDGSVVWSCDGLVSEKGDLTYSSPVLGDGVCMVAGGYDGPTLGVRIDGAGDVTRTHRVWRNERQMSNCGSGVYADGHFFIPDLGGFLWCIDAKTGARKWRERVARGNTWGSVVAAAGRLYLMHQNGTTVVFEPSAEKLAVLAENDLGEQTNSTPAIADGELFLRTHEHLYCIASER
jgi:outer membrane protein assembly factor BamB